MTAFVALLVLAGVEASLAVLRENIVESNAALERSLYGESATEAVVSSLPMFGQAALGFMLPFILAMVAIPLESLIQSTRYVGTAIVASLLFVLSNAVRMLRLSIDGVGAMIHALLDVFIAVPLLVGRALGSSKSAGRRSEAPTRVLSDRSGPRAALGPTLDPSLAGGKRGAR